MYDKLKYAYAKGDDNVIECDSLEGLSKEIKSRGVVIKTEPWLWAPSNFTLYVVMKISSSYEADKLKKDVKGLWGNKGSYIFYAIEAYKVSYLRDTYLFIANQIREDKKDIIKGEIREEYATMFDWVEELNVSN